VAESVGGDLYAVQQYVMNETFTQERAPRSLVPAVDSTVLVQGGDEQKKDFLSSMTMGTTNWCEGYTDLGFGLASLQTRAERDGDDFMVNRQKIVTSSMHVSNMSFMLVRTDQEAPEHRGIMYVLSSMDVQ